jgi:hypothetical protein
METSLGLEDTWFPLPSGKTGKFKSGSYLRPQCLKAEGEHQNFVHGIMVSSYHRSRSKWVIRAKSLRWILGIEQNENGKSSKEKGKKWEAGKQEIICINLEQRPLLGFFLVPGCFLCIGKASQFKGTQSTPVAIYR